MCSPRIFLFSVIPAISGCAMQMPESAKQISDSEDTAIIQQRAKFTYDSNDWTHAERYYLKLTQRFPKDAESWFRLGNIYVHLGRFHDAINAYRESIRHDRSNTKTWHNLGIVQLRQTVDTFVQLHQYS